MIHVIEGDGKGKTSAAVGMSVRAAGHGYKVLFMQFLKGDTSGEISVLRSIPDIEVVHCPVNYGFLFQMSEDRKKALAGEYNGMLDYAAASDAFLIVLDEAVHALNAGLISEEKLKCVMDKQKELVLTGWNAPKWLTDRADYVSEIRKGKHPFDKGVQARKGVEF